MAQWLSRVDQCPLGHGSQIVVSSGREEVQCTLHDEGFPSRRRPVMTAGDRSFEYPGSQCQVQQLCRSRLRPNPACRLSSLTKSDKMIFPLRAIALHFSRQRMAAGPGLFLFDFSRRSTGQHFSSPPFISVEVLGSENTARRVFRPISASSDAHITDLRALKPASNCLPLSGSTTT